ncbi:hypothetical protein CEE45_09125 [Candidatus Heimdallarchaeota archaeon B3_Heim]|nr:MAG: hypothetical protein CEE45_09125 [Candidatus Heimdallarchaeota archaeon B3_Heim]
MIFFSQDEMFQRIFVPIKDKIFTWIFRILVLSVSLSIISIFVTTDITQLDTPFLDIFISSFSNFTFFLGLIAIGAGLAIAIFKRSELTIDEQSSKQAFKPKYRKKTDKIKKISGKDESRITPPLFSPREIILLSSGGLSILIGILSWLIYAIIVGLFF